jgi:hypothetical protein
MKFESTGVVRVLDLGRGFDSTRRARVRHGKEGWLGVRRCPAIVIKLSRPLEKFQELQFSSDGDRVLCWREVGQLRIS